jgi:prephenate dehydrogenase
VPAESEAATARVEAFWRMLGALPERADAAGHDAEMAWISHLPQIAASALGLALAEEGIPARDLGPGGRDATRLAASDAPLWADILEHNRGSVRAPVAALRRALEHLDAALESGDRSNLERLLDAASRWKRADT